MLLLGISSCWFADIHLLTHLQIARDFGQIAVGVTRRHVDALRSPVGSDHIHIVARGILTERATGRRQHIAVSMDPDGTRASAAVAWLGPDDICYLTLLADVKGAPVDSSALGNQWREASVARRVAKVGFDPLTDAELAKFFKVPKPISGGEFSNATSNFVSRVRSGKLRWSGAEAVGTDLAWTARKENDETGSYQAVRANDDRPITAALAAIRAVWLATGLRPATPRIY